VARATPAPYLRPPYGSYDNEVLAAAGRASFAYTVLWDVDPQDWDTNDPGTVISRVLSGAKGGSIILLHTKPQTAQALETIIRSLRARGLQPVGLPELLG
jgi:peptidoglycan/xylan/chitin deacetylase (PgdA/CDA1 family)